MHTDRKAIEWLRLAFRGLVGSFSNSAQHSNVQLALTMMRSLPNTEELFALADHFEALAQTWDAIAVLLPLTWSADPACQARGAAFAGLMRRLISLLAASGNDEPPFLFKHAKLALHSK